MRIRPSVTGANAEGLPHDHWKRIARWRGFSRSTSRSADSSCACVRRKPPRAVRNERSSRGGSLGVFHSLPRRAVSRSATNCQTTRSPTWRINTSCPSLYPGRVEPSSHIITVYSPRLLRSRTIAAESPRQQAIGRPFTIRTRSPRRNRDGIAFKGILARPSWRGAGIEQMLGNPRPAHEPKDAFITVLHPPTAALQAYCQDHRLMMAGRPPRCPSMTQRRRRVNRDEAC